MYQVASIHSTSLIASTQGTGVSALAIETPLTYDLGWVFCGPLTRITGNRTRRAHQGLPEITAQDFSKRMSLLYSVLLLELHVAPFAMGHREMYP